nr:MULTISPECIES: hypothetical protein [Bacillus subtilis group]
MKITVAERRFQLIHGLSPEGIYGPKTKVKLEALLKYKSPTHDR